MPRAARRSPSPAASSALARRAFNDLVGFIAGWATVLDFVLTISLSALFLPYYFAGALGQYPDALSVRAAAVYGVGILVIVTTVRLARRTEIYTVGVAVAALDLVVQVGIAVLGARAALLVELAQEQHRSRRRCRRGTRSRSPSRSR